MVLLMRLFLCPGFSTRVGFNLNFFGNEKEFLLRAYGPVSIYVWLCFSAKRGNGLEHGNLHTKDLCGSGNEHCAGNWRDRGDCRWDQGVFQVEQR